MKAVAVVLVAVCVALVFADVPTTAHPSTAVPATDSPAKPTTSAPEKPTTSAPEKPTTSAPTMETTTAAPTTTDIPVSTEWWQKNWTNNTVNSRYKGQMPPYQIFMIIVGILCVLLAAAIFFFSKKAVTEDEYNPM